MSTQTLVQEAISLALSSDWDRAIEINEQILSDNLNDIDTLNRLAYAYTQNGNLDKAKKMYKKLLGFDKYNIIARKNYEKLLALGSKNKNEKPQKKSAPVHPYLFLEEPGKTKTVNLKNPAHINTLSNLRIGDKVNLLPKKHSIDIRDDDKNYLGALPDDIAFRLIHFLQMDNTYDVFVKNVQKNGISVFIKETKRGKRTHNQPTFQPNNSDYASSSPREIKSTVENKIETTTEDDQSSPDAEE